ncbi:hypothetical protein GCM10011371_34540 [Novosphingobium marinum]|uniref:Uncharacterized protein n=1 Tax=Novosphingobium marinum TaxID=1514948 RepID=A0A7Y9XYZ8_9SPHN|nr:hypothetical protein [Novosphingobium marinum]NYH97157.1 hypothetical protein [Novosphingobium marinum]GGC44200.1 hypothetical protein GCM10011371_34540 [Novosphingobium marinum]
MAAAVHVIILLVLAGFAITVFGAIVVWLVRFVIRFVAAAGVAIMAIVVAVGLGLEEWATVLLALAVFALTFSIFGRREGPESPPAVSPVSPPVRWECQHRAIAKAWCDIADYCPEMASELRREEQACAALLRAADGEPKSPGIDLDLIELTTLIKRHVPELAKGLRASGEGGQFHGARPAQDAARVLVLLGRQAQAILDRAGWVDADNFRLRVDHLNRRLRAFGETDRHTESMDFP